MNYFTSASTTLFKTGRNLTFIPFCSCRTQGNFDACLASLSFIVSISTHCWRAQTYAFPPEKQRRESVPPCRGWRNDCVRKELTTQAWGPELRSLALCERLGTKMWLCPRTGTKRQEARWGSLPARWDESASSRFREKPHLKKMTK